MKKKSDTLNLRKKATDYAYKQIKNQMEGECWGICGDWNNPYLTSRKAMNLRDWGIWKNVFKWLHISSLKPVHWSPS